MIPPGQTYRPDGTLNARSIASATILGITTAVLVAVLIWAWEMSPVPTLVIFTPVIQGLLIGMVLSFLIGRLKLRHPRLMSAVAIACGLGSVGLVHYAHHLHLLDQVAATMRARVEASPDLDAAGKQEALGKVAEHAGEVTDTYLIQKTGHGGLLGSMLLRAERGVEIKRSHVTGWGMWLLWGFEALVVVSAAKAMASNRASAPFCEECGAWCSKVAAPATVDGESAVALARAIQADDANAVGQMLGEPVDLETVGLDCARVGLHTCDGCDQTFADVGRQQVTFKNKKPVTVTTPLLAHVRVSPTMLDLLRGPVVVPGVSPPHEIPEHHVIDEPDALEGRDL